MTQPWELESDGAIELPSGIRLRGRALRRPVPVGLMPTLAVELTSRPPEPPQWERIWVRWRDFRVPADTESAVASLRFAHRRAAIDRVEFCCDGGIGRTGTALAALCVMDGMNRDDAVDFVRRTYHPRAVETPWQRRWLRNVDSDR